MLRCRSGEGLLSLTLVDVKLVELIGTWLGALGLCVWGQGLTFALIFNILTCFKTKYSQRYRECYRCLDLTLEKHSILRIPLEVFL